MNDKPGGITLPEFRIYCDATIIKNVQYWLSNGHTVQRNRLENPKQTHMYGQLNSDKGAKAIQWRKDSLFKKILLKTIENPWAKNEL